MFVMSYFTAANESLHIAISRDGRRFLPVNGGRPVLGGTVGTKALRDPFIGIGPDGVFHLLATDGWASTSIVHATSADLSSWSKQTLIPVMGDVAGAQNAWAPEFFYDRESASYHLIWSSVVDRDVRIDPTSLETVSQDHRIWSCATTDFTSFAPSRLFFDPGFPVIDATVLESETDGYLMAFKDERGSNDPSTRHKDIHLTSFAKAGGPYTELRGPVTRSIAEGPSMFRRGDTLVMLFDHYLDGRYGCATSRDGHTWQTETIDVPPGTRHASVLAVPSTKPLLDAWHAHTA